MVASTTLEIRITEPEARKIIAKAINEALGIALTAENVSIMYTNEEEPQFDGFAVYLKSALKPK